MKPMSLSDALRIAATGTDGVYILSVEKLHESAIALGQLLDRGIPAWLITSNWAVVHTCAGEAKSMEVFSSRRKAMEYYKKEIAYYREYEKKAGQSITAWADPPRLTSMPTGFHWCDE